MPAKSKAQQRLFGMVHAYQKGELDNPSKTIKKIGDNISFKKAKKFASTKHKKLPEKVDESSIKQYIPDAVYIVCDGTSCYGCFGCDIEDEIRDNEVEVVKGPFAQWNDRVDELIEKMNDKMYEGKMATTRLTESQLKKIVVESVKRVLNELDWKTYANAAGKLYQKARDGYYKYDTPHGEIPRDSEHGKLFQRAEKLQSMANDRFREDYGEPNYKTNPKGAEEFMHAANGDYKYSGKKGWHLKESVNDDMPSEVNKSQIEAAHKKKLLKQYRADFENACDDLYYGYGFKFWFNSCSETLSKEDAKIIWKAAIDRMGNDGF